MHQGLILVLALMLSTASTLAQDVSEKTQFQILTSTGLALDNHGSEANNSRRF